MPRRRGMDRHGRAARRAAAAAPVTGRWQARVEPVEEPAPPHGVDVEEPVAIAELGGDRLPYYERPGVYAQVSVTPQVSTRDIAAAAARMSTSLNRYVHALVRSNLDLVREVAELRAMLANGHDSQPEEEPWDEGHENTEDEQDLEEEPA